MRARFILINLILLLVTGTLGSPVIILQYYSKIKILNSEDGIDELPIKRFVRQ